MYKIKIWQFRVFVNNLLVLNFKFAKTFPETGSHHWVCYWFFSFSPYECRGSILKSATTASIPNSFHFSIHISSSHCTLYISRYRNIDTKITTSNKEIFLTLKVKEECDWKYSHKIWGKNFLIFRGRLILSLRYIRNTGLQLSDRTEKKQSRNLVRKRIWKSLAISPKPCVS